jgi:hypothetical protein
MSDDASGSDISTENTMRARADESGLKLWLLLGANRLGITIGIAIVFFVLFVFVGTVLYPPLQAIVANTSTLKYMFSQMIGAVITGVTLVVTISQLVISQENGPLGDQRRRMSNAMDFREYATELTGEPARADPSAFLRNLVQAAEDRTDELEAGISDHDNEELAREVSEFSESVTGNAETVRNQLEGAAFGTFDVLSAALNFNYGWKIFQVERIGDDYEDDLSDEENELLEELRTALAMFGPAREHIKTLYFQWALIDLSQVILYLAVPALLVSGCMLAFVDDGTFTGTILGIDHLLLVVGAAFTLTLTPFMLFTSYILRIATAAKRTLAIGPFILRESQR